MSSPNIASQGALQTSHRRYKSAKFGTRCRKNARHQPASPTATLLMGLMLGTRKKRPESRLFPCQMAEWTATQNAPQSMSQGVTGYYQIMKAPNCVVLLSPIAPHPVPAAAMGALMGCTTPRTGLCVREGQANQEIRSAASINFRMHHWSRSESLSVASTITCSPPFCSVIV